MRIVVTIAAVDPLHGGPPRTIPALCHALAQGGAQVELITVAESGNRPANRESDSFKITTIFTTATRYNPLAWRQPFCAAISRTLQNEGDVLLYDVGLWLPSNHFAAKIAARSRIPLMISPRGMLSGRALRVSKLRKKVAWTLYQRRNLQRAQVLHAASEAEAGDFRTLGLRQPIAIIPNGIDAPSAISARREDPVRTLLFLSRLHPIKGLSDLVRAWAQLRPLGWRVLIAGSDEKNYGKTIEALVQELRVEGDFEFVGPADDNAKWSLYAEADLFVLPSYSESFGQVIGEALAAAVPVITTQATPWRDVEEHDCGWWIPTGVDALAEALRSATALSPVNLQQMGQRGRELVLKKYSWEAAAEQMSNVFHWMVRGGEPPPCVRMAA